MNRRSFIEGMIAAGMAAALPVGELWRPTKKIFIPKEVGIKRLCAVAEFDGFHESVWPYYPENFSLGEMRGQRPWTKELLDETVFKICIPGGSGGITAQRQYLAMRTLQFSDD